MFITKLACITIPTKKLATSFVQQPVATESVYVAQPNTNPATVCSRVTDSGCSASKKVPF